MMALSSNNWHAYLAKRQAQGTIPIQIKRYFFHVIFEQTKFERHSKEIVLKMLQNQVLKGRIAGVISLCLDLSLIINILLFWLIIIHLFCCQQNY